MARGGWLTSHNISRWIWTPQISRNENKKFNLPRNISLMVNGWTYVNIIIHQSGRKKQIFKDVPNLKTTSVYTVQWVPWDHQRSPGIMWLAKPRTLGLNHTGLGLAQNWYPKYRHYPPWNQQFAPKNGWLEYYFPIAEAYFQVLC